VSVAAIGIICKAPQPGRSKTRLATAIGEVAASELSACFLRDVATAIEAAPEALGRRGYGVYAPAGAEHIMRQLLPAGFGLLLQAGDDLGYVLFGATRALLDADGENRRDHKRDHESRHVPAQLDAEHLGGV